MQFFLKKKYIPTIILRHRKENLKKCSLTGLEQRNDMLFYRYPTQNLPDLAVYVMLTIDAPILSPEENQSGIFLIDGTWKYAQKMQAFVESRQQVVKRSLPEGWKTAYPRKQEDCPLPDRGLASVEALFAAYCILGRSTEGLLDHYYWKEHYLSKNVLKISENCDF